jgi:hypothetical protein
LNGETFDEGGKLSVQQLERGKRVQAGIISLANADGPMFKRSLICRTGKFKGINGPVDVTAELLSRIAEKYNRERALPANEFDYAPVMKDHDRRVDNTLGRIMADLTVEDWTDPATGVIEKGLFGSLRIDDDEAQVKVKKGKYSQISLTFDDETDDLYEVSFVGVEAARRSQALAKGEKTMDLQVQLETKQRELTELSAKHEGMSLAMKTAAGSRKAHCLALVETLTSTETEITALQTQVKELAATIRTNSLGATLRSFIREGKMTKAEFDKLNVKALSAMPVEAVQAITDSYASRSPSADIIQHGQAGAKPVQLSMESASPEKMRELIAAQTSGKALAAEDERDGVDSSKPNADKAKGDEGKGDKEMAAGDLDELLKQSESMGGVVEKLSTALKSAMSRLKQLQEQDKEGSEEGSKSEENK